MVNWIWNRSWISALTSERGDTESLSRYRLVQDQFSTCATMRWSTIYTSEAPHQVLLLYEHASLLEISFLRKQAFAQNSVVADCSWFMFPVLHRMQFSATKCYLTILSFCVLFTPLCLFLFTCNSVHGLIGFGADWHILFFSEGPEPSSVKNVRNTYKRSRIKLVRPVHPLNPKVTYSGLTEILKTRKHT